MARYHRDKERQLSCWPEHEELNNVPTTENFMDEYVSFGLDGFIKDPQSPSVILDSLDESERNSSHEHELFPASSFEEAADFIFPDSLDELNQSLPVFLRNVVPASGPGSITDSELLLPEGVSLESPNGNTTASSNSPLLSQLSSTKLDQFVDSVHAASWEATHQSSPLGTSTTTSAMDVFERGLGPIHQMPELFEFTTNCFDFKPGPIDNNGLPLSPPLTERIPQAGSHSSTAPSMTGHFDDLFCDSIMDPPIIHGPTTPMSTPVFEDDIFYSHGTPTLPNNTQTHRLEQSNASSAEWPKEGLFNDDNPQLWNVTGSSHIPDDSAIQDPGWWEDLSTPGAHGRPRHHQHSAARQASVLLNHVVHHGTFETPFEYTTDFPDLVIHTPQPRQPPATVLTSNTPDRLLTPMHRPCSSSQHTRSPYTDRHHQYRRPQPGASSLGARRHHHRPMTPPCRPLPRHTSPRGMMNRRESVSPSPSAYRPRRTTSSSSISMRKQRSWSRGPRTPNTGSQAGSFHSNGSSPLGGDGGGRGGINFVNFTPGDKKLLMTGVAPSGSGKTKARREKEAADRRRVLSEAAVKAVQAVGGDVDQLVRDGFQF